MIWNLLRCCCITSKSNFDTLHFEHLVIMINEGQLWPCYSAGRVIIIILLRLMIIEKEYGVPELTVSWSPWPLQHCSIILLLLPLRPVWETWTSCTLDTVDTLLTQHQVTQMDDHPLTEKLGSVNRVVSLADANLLRLNTLSQSNLFMLLNMINRKWSYLWKSTEHVELWNSISIIHTSINYSIKIRNWFSFYNIIIFHANNE